MFGKGWFKKLSDDIKAINQEDIDELNADLPRRKKEKLIGVLSPDLVKFLVLNEKQMASFKEKASACQLRLNPCPARTFMVNQVENSAETELSPEDYIKLCEEMIKEGGELSVKQRVLDETIRIEYKAAENVVLEIRRGFEVVEIPMREKSAMGKMLDMMFDGFGGAIIDPRIFK